MASPVRIRAVAPMDGFWVHLEFTNGTERDVDLSPFLRGPIFEPLRRDPGLFRRVRVDERMKTLVWGNGADIDPDVLYRGLQPAWMEDEGAVHMGSGGSLTDQRS